MSTHVYTSITANYIPKARVLANSIRKYHPEFVIHVLLIDTIPPEFNLSHEPFDHLITLSDLRLPHPQQWMFSHTLVEASTGLKGAVLLRLLTTPGCRQAFYFDPDIVVLAPLDGLIAEFESASVLLTPHLTLPEDSMEAVRDNELSVLKHGIYNLGFLGVRRSDEGLAFARWWADRLYEFCFDDIPNGIFTDQRWADLVPAAFPGVAILRDPVYNVATWNLTKRKIAGTAPDGLTVDGRRLVFYHFSGFDSGAQLEMLNKYGSEMPALHALRDWYIAQCEQNGQSEFGSLPWVYSCFDNCTTIANEYRRLYRERVDLQRAFPDPFSTADVNRSYYHWLLAEGATRPGAPVNCTLDLPRSANWQRTDTDAGAAGTATLVYLYGSSATRSQVGLTIESLRANAANRVEIVCIGDRQLLTAWDVESFAAAPLECDAQDWNQAFLYALQAAEGGDFFFVKAGVLVPEYWDARLRWSALRETAVATAAPLSSASESTRVLETDPGNLSQTAVDALDRFCYHNSQREHIAVDELPRDVLFVNGKAAREVLAFAQPADARAWFAAASQLRWSHIIADHIHIGAAGVRRPFAFSKPAPLAVRALRDQVRRLQSGFEYSSLAPVRRVARRRQLHVCHSWGGGSRAFVSHYAAADRDHENFFLASMGSWGAFGQQLWLFRNVGDSDPIRRWQLDPAVKSTAVHHSGYAAILSEIVQTYAIDVIVISSFIGHSLDLLRLPTRNLIVLHDYYPVCPALNITFQQVCHTCTLEKLIACTGENPHHRFFRNVPAAYWLELREELLRAILASDTALIAPTGHVRENLLRFLPALEPRINVIEHGTPELNSPPLDLKFDHERLQIVILGQLSENKGTSLLNEALPELTRFCDLHLLGTGEEGARYQGLSGVSVTLRYQHESLPQLLASIEPDAGLLLSTVPETFSYTLHELFEMAVPPIATNIGSFAERVVDGETGLLVEPSAKSVLARLSAVHRERSALRHIHKRLKNIRMRRLPEMLQDYEAVIARPPISASAYFQRPQSAVVNAAARAAQLYWREEGGAFSEAHSVIVRYEVTTDPRKVRLDLPAQRNAPVALRYDPSDRPGFLLLHRIRLIDLAGDCVWQWDARSAPFEGESESILPVVQGGMAALLYCAGDDPAMILPIPPGDLERVRKGGTLELDLACPSTDQACDSLVALLLHVNSSALPAKHASRILDRMLKESKHTPAGPAADQLQAQLTRARARILDLESSFSWRLSAPGRAAWRVWLDLRAHYSGSRFSAKQ